MTIALRGSLAGHRTADDGPRAIELPEGADAAALLAACGVDRRGCVVVVNGAVATPATALHGDDRVQVYPAQAGG